MEKEQLKEKLKANLAGLEKNKSTFDEKAVFEYLYDCLETMKVIQKIEDREIYILKKQMGPHAYPQVNRFNKISYTFYQACKNYFPKMNPNPLTELKKFSPFINNENGGKMGIVDENDFDTIYNVLVIIRNNLKNVPIKEYTEQDKQAVILANKILHKIVSAYVGDIKSEQGFKISNLVPFIWLILLGALMFFYLFGSMFFEDNSGPMPENCAWQYTQDNVVCW